jgi:uncharacterized protein (TIGR02246 family)
MTTQVSSPSTASEILAAAGVEEDLSFYRSFTDAAQKAVLTVPQQIQAAWATNDPDVFADIFTENGSLLMSDTQLTSREQIREYMTNGFNGYLRGAHVTGFPLSVKFLRDDVAFVVTEGGIIFAGDTDVKPENAIRATWIIVQRDGAWKLFSHQSSPITG